MKNPEFFTASWRDYTLQIPGDYPMPWVGETLWINYVQYLNSGQDSRQFVEDLGVDSLTVRAIKGNHCELIKHEEASEEDLKAGLFVLLDEFVDFKKLRKYWTKHPESYPIYILG